CRYFKYVSVVLFVLSVLAAFIGLLTGEPASPGCGAARAVADGPCQGKVFQFHLPGGFIIDQGCSPAQGRVFPKAVVVNKRTVNFGKQLPVLPERTIFHII